MMCDPKRTLAIRAPHLSKRPRHAENVYVHDVLQERASYLGVCYMYACGSVGLCVCVCVCVCVRLRVRARTHRPYKMYGGVHRVGRISNYYKIFSDKRFNCSLFSLHNLLGRATYLRTTLFVSVKVGEIAI